MGKQQEDLLKKDCQLVDPDMADEAMLKEFKESIKRIEERRNKTKSPGT